MSEYIPVTVEAAQQISNAFDKDIVVLICYNHEHNLFHTTTYGRLPTDKDGAAAIGDRVVAFLGGDIGLKKSFEDFREPSEAAKIKEERDRLLIENAELRIRIDSLDNELLHGEK